MKMLKLPAKVLYSVLIGKKKKSGCFIRLGSADVFVGDCAVVSTVLRTVPLWLRSGKYCA